MRAVLTYPNKREETKSADGKKYTKINPLAIFLPVARIPLPMSRTVPPFPTAHTFCASQDGPRNLGF